MKQQNKANETKQSNTVKMQKQRVKQNKQKLN